MARLTVEDCLEHVDNRFELILKASARARKLSQGADALVPWENDKPTVVALREIALGLEPAIPDPEQEAISVEQAFKEEMQEFEAKAAMDSMSDGEIKELQDEKVGAPAETEAVQKETLSAAIEPADDSEPTIADGAASSEDKQKTDGDAS